MVGKTEDFVLAPCALASAAHDFGGRAAHTSAAAADAVSRGQAVTARLTTAPPVCGNPLLTCLKVLA
jgi:hypothetical protein